MAAGCGGAFGRVKQCAGVVVQAGRAVGGAVVAALGRLDLALESNKLLPELKPPAEMETSEECREVSAARLEAACVGGVGGWGKVCSNIRQCCSRGRHLASSHPAVHTAVKIAAARPAPPPLPDRSGPS